MFLASPGDKLVKNLDTRVFKVDQGEFCCQLEGVWLEFNRVHFVLGCLLCYLVTVCDNLDPLAL